MYLSTCFPKRAAAAVGLIASLSALSGCSNHKIIARVNGTPINDEEYQTFVSHVRSNDFQGFAQMNIQTDAGGAGMVTAVKEKLLEELGAEKHVVPSEEAVKRHMAYLTRSNPQVSAALEAGQISLEDLPRVIRDQMILVALGSNNANVSEDDIKKEYSNNKQQYDYPEIDGIRVVPVPSSTEGIQLLNQIKATGDFASAAAKFNPQAGTIRYLALDRPAPAPQLPPQLKDALAGLKDGQLAPAPITLNTPGAPNTPPTIVVVQLVRRMPKGEAKIEEVHEAIREHELQKNMPQLLQHAQEQLNDYNQKANVEVFVDRYKSLVKTALTPPPASPVMGGPGGGTQPGGGAQPGAAPQMRPGTPIRPGAGTPAPQPTIRTAPTGSGSAAPSADTKSTAPPASGGPAKSAPEGGSKQ